MTAVDVAPAVVSSGEDYMAHALRTTRASTEQRRTAAMDLSNSARAALEWAVLKRWERDYEFGSFRFECDTVHACHTAPTGTIVCFNRALNFYGCTLCRRAHFCRGRWDDCILVLGNDGGYTCAFSGRIVEYDMAAGNFDEEVRIGSLSKKDAVSRGGDTLENMHVTGTALRDHLTRAKEWHRQTERQKRWREPNGEDEGHADEHSADDSVRSAKRARRDTEVEESSDNGELDDDFDAGDEGEIHGYGTETLPMDYGDIEPMPLENATRGRRGRRTEGDGEFDDMHLGGDGDGAADDDGGGGFGGGGGGGGGGGERTSRYTTTDVYRSGLLVTQWTRNMNRVLSKPHNLEPLDTTVVPTSFLASVPLDLNRYHTMEHALRQFDTEYATELSGVAQQFDAAGTGFGGDDADGDDSTTDVLRKSTTTTVSEGSAPSTPTQSTALVDATRTIHSRQYTYNRTLRRARRGIENDVCSVLRALHGRRTDTEMEYVNFSIRLFQLLLRDDPMHMPMHLQKIGFVVVLDLLLKPFVVTDSLMQLNKTRKKREYNHIIWNADETLAEWQRSGLLDLLFVDEGHRNMTPDARYTRAQLECVYKFRRQQQIKRANFKQWTSDTRHVLMRMATASPTAFHAALFSCPLL